MWLVRCGSSDSSDIDYILFEMFETKYAFRNMWS